MKIDEDSIKSLPITTNKIDVVFNRDLFFSKYAIVSYYGTNNESKNLAYEHFADTPCLSVTGIWARWNEQGYGSIHFFILVEKGKEADILISLRSYDFLRSQIDTLEGYDMNLQKRIIASLAINSLGKNKKGKLMYNGGALLICDDKNFGIRKSRQELVCLKIEVNEYMNLTAKTTSFSNPSSIKELGKLRNCVFHVGSDIGGFLWEGQSVKPIVIKDYKGCKYNLQELYVQKKRFKDNKNTIPYWPYDIENYSHGKLFALSQIVNSVNNNFNGLLEISFCDFPVLHYDECKTGNEMLSMLQNYLSGKSILIDNPIKTTSSKEIVEQFKTEAQTLLNGKLLFPKKALGNEMIIRICEPKDENLEQTFYSKSLDRALNSNCALQHITLNGNKKEDQINKVKARRILIDLLVKDSLINRIMPEPLTNLILGWEFFRYKINSGLVNGASLSVDKNGSMSIQEYGLSLNSFGDDFGQFVYENFKFSDYKRIQGSKDYMALKKDGNVYLIIDTEEIPILDVNLIDEGYNKVVNEGEPIALFKRKKNAHAYLRGYIGFHLWRSDGLDGEKDAAYSYISGTNSENMQIKNGAKMDKMPRARRIFILHKEKHESIESNIKEICSMLKFGFGRWNELMTYPFPFKFLQEYLDNVCETVYSKHWEDITYKGEL